MSQITSLYRHWDAEGRLLYVGISISALARQIAHRADAHWWDEVTRITIERFSSVAEAENAERVAIAAENPLHNTIRRKPRPQPAFEPQTPKPSFEIRDGMSAVEREVMLSEAYEAGWARGAELAQEDRRRERAERAARFALSLSAVDGRLVP